MDKQELWTALEHLGDVEKATKDLKDMRHGDAVLIARAIERALARVAPEVSRTRRLSPSG